MKKKRKKRSRVKRRRMKLTRDHRFIYIMMRASNRSAYSKITRQAEYKIGIAKDPETRLKQVDKALKGEVRVVRTYLCPNAQRLEKYLHRKFSDSRFRIKAVGRGAGETEWFYMTDAEYVALEISMWIGWAEQLVKPTIYLIIIIILLYTYGQKVLIGS